MKTLILNGSPHKNGDTSYIVNELKKKIDGEIEEIFLYDAKLSPCIDCRYCWKNKGYSIKDDMQKINNDDYDLLIIASPVYFYNVTPPMFSLLTRLNYIWSNKHFLDITHTFKNKRGILVLTGGGGGEPKHALDTVNLIFKYLNAEFDSEKDYIYSLNTDNVSAKDDINVKKMIEKIDF